jgi:hypothetical protein
MGEARRRKNHPDYTPPSSRVFPPQAEQAARPRTAVRWRELREQNGEPVPTAEQVVRAGNLAIGQHRHLGRGDVRLQELALHVPLSRHEKVRMREDAHEKGLVQPICAPTQRRKAPPIAHPNAVDAYLKGNPQTHSPEELTAQFGRGVGYATPEAVEAAARRAQRFFLNGQHKPGRRIPRHIRDKAVLASAIVQGIVKEFPNLAPPESVEAAMAIRSMVQPAVAAAA